MDMNPGRARLLQAKRKHKKCVWIYILYNICNCEGINRWVPLQIASIAESFSTSSWYNSCSIIPWHIIGLPPYTWTFYCANIFIRPRLTLKTPGNLFLQMKIWILRIKKWPYLIGLFWYNRGRVSSMMTSSNGNNFRVTGHLCGEFTGPRWIHRTKASDAELWCFLWSASE